MNASPLKNHQFFLTAYFIASGNRLQLVQYLDPQRQELQTTVPRGVELSLSLFEMEKYFTDGTVHVDLGPTSSLPPPMTAYPRQLGCKAAAYVPILQKGKLRGLVLIGAREGQKLTDDIVDVLTKTIRLTINAMDGPTSSETISER